MPFLPTNIERTCQLPLLYPLHMPHLSVSCHVEGDFFRIKKNKKTQINSIVILLILFLFKQTTTSAIAYKNKKTFTIGMKTPESFVPFCTIVT